MAPTACINSALRENFFYPGGNRALVQVSLLYYTTFGWTKTVEFLSAIGKMTAYRSLTIMETFLKNGPIYPNPVTFGYMTT